MKEIIFDKVQSFYLLNKIVNKSQLENRAPVFFSEEFGGIVDRLKHVSGLVDIFESTADDSPFCGVIYGDMIEKSKGESLQIQVHLSRLVRIGFITWGVLELRNDFGPGVKGVIHRYNGERTAIISDFEKRAHDILIECGWLPVHENDLVNPPVNRLDIPVELREIPPIEVLFGHWKGHDGKYHC